MVNLFTTLRKKLFGIVQTPMPEFFWKNNRSGYDRSGEGAATRFVDSGDDRDTERTQFAFMPEATTTIHGRSGT